jgi:hypothetical protein
VNFVVNDIDPTVIQSMTNIAVYVDQQHGGRARPRVCVRYPISHGDQQIGKAREAFNGLFDALVRLALLQTKYCESPTAA